MKNIVSICILVALTASSCKNPTEKQAVATVPPPPPVEAPATPVASATAESELVTFAKQTSQAIQGRWRSTLDTKSEIKIAGDELTDIYNGKTVATSQLSYSADCKLTECKQGPKDCFMTIDKTTSLCYFITKLTATEFQYTMVGGKSQSFKRVGATIIKDCPIVAGAIKGVKLGDPMSVVKETYPVKIQKKTGEGSFDAYVMFKDNVNDVMIFPIKKGGKEVVNLVEYTGACETTQGVKVGSTLAELKKAYPDLKAFGSEIEGRTIAKGGGYTFLLDAYESAYDLDLAKLKATVKVKAIVLQ
jgi:hypothetical protein